MKLAIVLLCSLAVLFAPALAGPITTSGLATQLLAGPADIIISFASTVSTLKAARSLKAETRAARITGLRDLLLGFSNQSQKNVVAFLQSKSIESSQLWISNELYVQNADAKLVAELSKFPEVEGIRENRVFPAPQAKLIKQGFSVRANNILAEWGVENIQANVVWTYPGEDLTRLKFDRQGNILQFCVQCSGGGTGEGVRVATIDTGVRGSHEALADSFYGDYGWFDPYIFSTTPNDQNGHGTHVTATITGSGGIGKRKIEIL